MWPTFLRVVKFLLAEICWFKDVSAKKQCRVCLCRLNFSGADVCVRKSVWFTILHWCGFNCVFSPNQQTTITCSVELFSPISCIFMSAVSAILWVMSPTCAHKHCLAWSWKSTWVHAFEIPRILLWGLTQAWLCNCVSQQWVLCGQLCYICGKWLQCWLVWVHCPMSSNICSKYRFHNRLHVLEFCSLFQHFYSSG